MRGHAACVRSTEDYIKERIELCGAAAVWAQVPKSKVLCGKGSARASSPDGLAWPRTFSAYPLYVVAERV